MSEFYAGADERESIATIQRAIDPCIAFLDTADVCTDPSQMKIWSAGPQLALAWVLAQGKTLFPYRAPRDGTI